MEETICTRVFSSPIFSFENSWRIFRSSASNISILQHPLSPSHFNLLPLAISRYFYPRSVLCFFYIYDTVVFYFLWSWLLRVLSRFLKYHYKPPVNNLIIINPINNIESSIQKNFVSQNFCLKKVSKLNFLFFFFRIVSM